ncbi:MAG: hypothetical protein M1480_19760 [Bacteroidetes bacterium]|nr:hypothetical protein [Bacteroidota bacterium]
MPALGKNFKVDENHLHFSDILSKNGLETEIENFVKDSLTKIKFSLIIKPAIISFVALIISFFLDLSNVPILGNISFTIAKYFFPFWKPAAANYEPISFWWLPVLIYILYIFLVKLAYEKLKLELVRTPASETIDRVITSYSSVIDSISTALPLIGAAILLISIRLGEAVFLGFSVPFEIKALIILALGKLFEPVLDQLGVEFQNIVNHVRDLKDRYFSRIQVENSKNILNKLGSGNEFSAPSISNETLHNLKEFNTILENISKLSNSLSKDFGSLNHLVEKFNSISDLSNEKIEQFKSISESIMKATSSLSDEKTISGLKHLEAIVTKK